MSTNSTDSRQLTTPDEVWDAFERYEMRDMTRADLQAIAAHASDPAIWLAAKQARVLKRMQRPHVR